MIASLQHFGEGLLVKLNNKGREVTKMINLTILLFLTPMFVSGDESKPIVAMIKRHVIDEHWKDCLIVTLGLNSEIVNNLVRTVSNHTIWKK
jgi:hypothetical protein